MANSINDVLVFTPVYRLAAETVQALCSLEWDGPLAVLLQRDNPFRKGNGDNDGLANHWHQYVRGRELFLHGRHDAMLVIESDIIPPADTLQRLAAMDVDVAYGTYVFRSSHPVVNVFERYRKPARNVGQSLTVRGLWGQALQQGIVECSGGGLGCILIKRRVLEAVSFRLEPNSGHCDTPWTRDVYRAGFEMKADVRLQCGHVDVDGTVLYPEAVG